MLKHYFLLFLLASVLVSGKVSSKNSESAQPSNFDAKNSDQVRAFLNDVTADILADRTFGNGTLWNYPAHLGLRFISEYYVALHYLGLENKTAFNTTTYKQIALSTQLENGSWKQLADPMVTDGQIDSTIEAYWALKIMGEDINAPHMKKAREWILNYGGLEQSSTLTKYFLSLFGQYDWENHIYIPLILFRNDSIFQYTFIDNFVAQWVYPHLVAMVYLRYYKVGRDFGPRFSVQELYIEKPQSKTYNVSKPVGEPDADILRIIKLQLAIQQHNGGFGAYTVSSLLNMAALQDFSSAYPHLFNEEIKVGVQRAFEFLEVTYVTDERAGYKGMLMHGAWWDHILVTLGLAEAKVPAEKLTTTFDHIVKEGQQENGALCYGYGFEYVPDADDTALAVMAMLEFGDRYNPNIKRAVNWLIDMQNNDGGFGAFHKGKGVNYIIKFGAGKIADSAEIFDQSSVDLTAHVLEAWAKYGYNYTEPFVQKAIAYLKREQLDFGSWEARWATNFINSAGCVISSLGKLGYNMSEPWLKKAVNWMVSKQNEDGGWGETHMSYNDVNLAGVGVSTPTHTAWVLFGLLEIADSQDYDVTDQIFKAIDYLNKAYQKHGEWLDESPVGTGHRGILTMQYPAYAKSFPVMAVARYLNKFGEGKVCSPLNNYCRQTGVNEAVGERNVEVDL